jgi:putative ABC transport system permease protein
METLLRDLRYGSRMLLREPGFTLLAILALALGIGATTAVFTVVDSVLLRPLPYKDPDRLVVALRGPTANGPVAPADYFDYKRDAQSFARLGAAQAWGATLAGGERPERIAGLQVSPDLFDLLGVPALVGRTFAAGEDQPGQNRIVVISHGLWQRRFGADRSVIGRVVRLDAEPYVIVGVMPASFRFAPFWQTRAEMWVPLALGNRASDRAGKSLRLFGRLKDGVSVTQAQTEISALGARLERAYPETNTGVSLTVRPLLDKVVSGIKRTLVALMAMVAFVLLIACANVANTLLARAAARQREVALRTAIGASRARLVRQLLTESVLLATIGAAAGLAFALWAVNWLLSVLPPGSLPRQQEVSFDLRIFVVACLTTVVAGITAGLAPALQLLKTSLTSAFQDGAKGATEGTTRKRFRSLLVAGEMTLALVLLVGAALMGRTMLKLSAVDPGFQIDDVAVATLSLAGTPHAEPAARYRTFVRLRERLATMPGVQSVSAINHLPLAGDIWNLGYRIEGRPAPAVGQGLSAVYRIVEPGYFSTMGLPLLNGRDFSDADTATAAPVAIINRAMAERRWPGETAVGRRIYLPGMSDVQAAITIVGVAGDARQSDWTSAPDDEVYLAHAQRATEFGLSAMTFVLKTSVAPNQVSASISREVTFVDPGVTVSEPTTLEAVAADELWRERLTANLTGMFALVALGLAAIGLYAVVAYSVARRTREFGVRLALGATTRQVQRLALVEGLAPVLIGAVVGLSFALTLSRLIRTLLFEVSVVDPLAIGAAAAALIGVSVIAAWVPARRASRLDPVAALRQE